jgi:sulfatase modifying factor 1
MRPLILFVLAATSWMVMTAQAPASLDLGAGIAVELVRIPSGEFMMGESNLNRSSIGYFAPHDLIARTVQITRPFDAGKYPVTLAQFERFVNATNYVTDAESGKRPWRGLTKGEYTIVDGVWGPKADANWRNPGFPQSPTSPVTSISWYDADAFCRWASKQTGENVRLPTEAELEYLERAGTETPYFWGAHPDDHGTLANVADYGIAGDEDIFPDGQPPMKTFTREGRDDGYRYTTPVGFYQPNLFGVYDAIGNVWEYTRDWEGADPPRVDPLGATSEPFRSMKGGSWMSSPDFYRPSIRLAIEPESRTSTRGFRVVVER